MRTGHKTKSLLSLATVRTRVKMLSGGPDSFLYLQNLRDINILISDDYLYMTGINPVFLKHQSSS